MLAPPPHPSERPLAALSQGACREAPKRACAALLPAQSGPAWRHPVASASRPDVSRAQGQLLQGLSALCPAVCAAQQPAGSCSWLALPPRVLVLPLLLLFFPAAGVTVLIASGLLKRSGMQFAYRQRNRAPQCEDWCGMGATSVTCWHDEPESV